MFTLFLFLHVLGAIAVFGPTFIFPLIASQAQKSPQHSHFAAELSETIESKIVIPGAIVQGITGLLLIATGSIDLASPDRHWLILAIVLYLIAIGFAITRQAPAAVRMVQLTGAMAGPPPAGVPAGPPPEIVATGKQLQQGGILLTVLIVAIVVLMVAKPEIG